MKAITTTYKGPTNTRGSRLIASDEDGNRVSVPYDHALNSEGNHQAAAQKLKNKMGWKGEMVGGGTKKGMVWVFVKGTPRVNPAPRVPGVRIVYNRLLGGWYVVRGPHQTPLKGRFSSKAEAQAWLARRNPAPRIGTRNVRRRSQATGRAPSRRLINRRARNSRKGFFPNPVKFRHAWLERYFNKPTDKITRGDLQRHNLDYNAAGVWIVSEDKKICDASEGERACLNTIARELQTPVRKKVLPNPREAARLQRRAYEDSGIHIDIGSHNMKRNPRKKRRTVHRKRRRSYKGHVPSQFAGLPYLLKLRGSIVAGFKALPRAKEYARKLSRHERAPVGIFKR